MLLSKKVHYMKYTQLKTSLLAELVIGDWVKKESSQGYDLVVRGQWIHVTGLNPAKRKKLGI